ncbi:hypothetical protein D6T63_00990 [Arthrobacter cheniae]|uniref:Uncharacterized protein n=1 Tax=Arthrobacter cheniae TaxID=1258888 RepID=A0A3A5MHK0_9MICC|nr:hypothetical protein [Arthrobacter cheniae]RJT83066.1 hypothetical protein D6T63_00990 [Arthrobacter cheniae]
MSQTPRRRYRVRLRKAVAGSFLAAAVTASLSGLAAGPSSAVPPRTVAASSGHSDVEAIDTIPDLDPVTSMGVASPVDTGVGQSAGERLAGVRADLDRAVLLSMVTPDQANGFFAQIERRVAAGL